MTKRQLHQLPIYTRVWNWLKLFPKVLARGSQDRPTVSGTAAAAIVSAGLGCFLSLFAHHLLEFLEVLELKVQYDAFKSVTKSIGSWIPGSLNKGEWYGYGDLGTYAGQETLLLIGWLGSWILLHLLWRNRNFTIKTLFLWFFVLFIAATIMTWHPLFPYLPMT